MWKMKAQEPSSLDKEQSIVEHLRNSMLWRAHQLVIKFLCIALKLHIHRQTHRHIHRHTPRDIHTHVYVYMCYIQVTL